MYKGEKFNSITHLVGAVLSVVGLVILIVSAARSGDVWRIVSFSIYGSTLVLLYTFSALSHGIPGKAGEVLTIFDYNAIYLLIAGTYTPLALVTIRGPWGWSIFGVIWGLAVVGIVVDSVFRKGKRIWPIIIYLLMGWLALVALVPIWKAMPRPGFVMMAVGGVVYTVGLVFYLLDSKFKAAHGIWHLFVIAASAIHYFMVLLYVR